MRTARLATRARSYRDDSPGRRAVGAGYPPLAGCGEVGGVKELVGCRGAASGLGHGGLAGVVGQGAAGDVVVQAGCERAAAQGLQEMLAGLGQDVTAGESSCGR
ncbi:hypothetical protein ACWIGY_32630 [Streptomyces anulatus]